MDLATFRQLLSPQGQRALQEAASYQPEEQDFLRLYSMLSRAYPADLARAALETASLRRQAVDKFPLAARMYFTRQALEQATHHAVAAYRSRRFAGFESLLDLGCSIGGDTMALAQLAPTLGIDMDALRLAMARENLAAAGLEERAHFAQADLHELARDTLSLMRYRLEKRGITLAMDFCTDGPLYAEIDANKIKQVLLNLCLNAMQAMDEQGGTLTIGTGTDPDTGHVLLTVSDTGGGRRSVMARATLVPTRSDGGG